MDQSICCQDMLSLRQSATPFSKMIVLEWFDGPVSGIVRCNQCQSTYKFDMLTWDINGQYDYAEWDAGKEIRIFTLAPLDRGVFEQLVDVLSQTRGAPTWPLWFCYFNRAFSSEEAQKRLTEQLNQVLNSVRPPSFVIASHDLLQEILRVKEVSASDLAELQKDNWFSFLGFHKG